MTNTPLSRTLAEAANLISNEDYQTRERDRQMANTGKLGSSVDSKEKASKKVYGKDGKVVAKNLNAFVKKANSPKNEDIEEAAKASPQEDEFLTDLTKAQIAAISPLLKSKDTNKLKAYLVSQKIVDKDFNDIQGYKMDRDVLSVLQRSFKDYHEQVENVEEGALNDFAAKLPSGINLGKIIGGTQAWRSVDRNTDMKKSVVTLTSEIKKIAHMVGNPDPKTIDAIAKALIADSKARLNKKESVEHIEEAAGDASSPEAMVLKFNKMSDVNDHNGAAILLATFLKDTKAMKCLKLVKQIHELESSMPHEIWAYRAKWSKQLWEVFSKKYPQVKH